MTAEEQARADIVEVGRRLWERGYVASNDGNISVRLDEHRLITTPKSVSKGFMTPDMMVIVDRDGKKVAGDRDPSSELPMHLEIYHNRPDVNAVNLDRDLRVTESMCCIHVTHPSRGARSRALGGAPMGPRTLLPVTLAT